MKTSRRQFIQSASIVSIGFLGLNRLVQALPKNEAFGYGPLKKDPSGILNLPEGFSYRIISRAGDRMSDGFYSPGRPDGMATFANKQGRLILIRNHEIDPGSDDGPYGKGLSLLDKMNRKKVYDFGSGKTPSTGGTSTLVYNEKTGEVETSYLSLTGTNRNCAGGLTPWGSWISCEENTDRADGTMEKNHGYNFEVPASRKPQLVDPVPLKEMGRFNHEAVSIDPKTSIVYQTEDRPDGIIYRFIPYVSEQLSQGGRLQALVVKEQPSFDTRNWKDLDGPKMPLRQPMTIEWIDLQDVDSPEDDLRYRGFDQGAARFARGEGMWFGENELFFACTNGGKIGAGQVFRYVPSPYEGTDREKEAPGQLELFLESEDTDLLKSCDNLTITPWGDLMLCEDDPHPFIVGVTRQGELYKLGENVGFPSEFAGGVFSPSGETYFVNIQDAGLTLAITGPWQEGLKKA